MDVLRVGGDVDAVALADLVAPGDADPAEGIPLAAALRTPNFWLLGISLFALSSYESQFMQRSLDSEQAFNLASSGLQRARYRLSAKGILGDVKALQGTDGITYAVASRRSGDMRTSVIVVT